MKFIYILYLSIFTGAASFGQESFCDSLDLLSYQRLDSILPYTDLVKKESLSKAKLDTLRGFITQNAYLLSDNSLVIRDGNQNHYYELPWFIGFKVSIDSTRTVDLKFSESNEVLIYYTDEFYRTITGNPPYIEEYSIVNYVNERYSGLILLDIGQKKIIGHFLIDYYSDYTWFHFQDSLGKEVEFPLSWEYYENKEDSIADYIEHNLEEVASSKTSQGKCKITIAEGRIILDCVNKFSITTSQVNDSCVLLETVNYEVGPEFLIKEN